MKAVTGRPTEFAERLNFVAVVVVGKQPYVVGILALEHVYPGAQEFTNLTRLTCRKVGGLICAIGHAAPLVAGLRGTVGQES